MDTPVFGLRAWESALVPAAAATIAFEGPGEALIVRVDPDLEQLRAEALAAGVTAAAVEAFYQQFSGASGTA
jgi:hypothetical protein